MGVRGLFCFAMRELLYWPQLAAAWLSAYLEKWCYSYPLMASIHFRETHQKSFAAASKSRPFWELKQLWLVIKFILIFVLFHVPFVCMRNDLLLPDGVFWKNSKTKVFPSNINHHVEPKKKTLTALFVILIISCLLGWVERMEKGLSFDKFYFRSFKDASFCTYLF